MGGFRRAKGDVQNTSIVPTKEYSVKAKDSHECLQMKRRISLIVSSI